MSYNNRRTGFYSLAALPSVAAVARLFYHHGLNVLIPEQQQPMPTLKNMAEDVDLYVQHPESPHRLAVEVKWAKAYDFTMSLPPELIVSSLFAINKRPWRYAVADKGLNKVALFKSDKAHQWPHRIPENARYQAEYVYAPIEAATIYDIPKKHD